MPRFRLMGVGLGMTLLSDTGLQVCISKGT